MIVFDLKCGNDHVFEAYFADSATYEDQVDRRQIACPTCGDVEIIKAPMAPNIAVSGKRKGDTSPGVPKGKVPNELPSPGEVAKAITQLRKIRGFVEKNFDHVGERFPEEARKIHYGEVKKRNIYGDATKEEVGALEEEGIEIGEIPWVPPHDA